MRYVEYNEKTGKREEHEMPGEEYDKIFNPFFEAQPKDETELYIYRDVVEELTMQQLKMVSPYLIADYAKYQALREGFFDRSHEKVCPYCEETVKLTDMHKRSYDEIAVALMRLIKLYSGELEVGIHAI